MTGETLSDWGATESEETTTDSEISPGDETEICIYCGHKTFSRKGNSRGNTFQCAECSEGELFDCDNCGEVFIVETSLQNHYLTPSEKTCPYCRDCVLVDRRTNYSITVKSGETTGKTSTGVEQ